MRDIVFLFHQKGFARSTFINLSPHLPSSMSPPAKEERSKKTRQKGQKMTRWQTNQDICRILHTVTIRQNSIQTFLTRTTEGQIII